MGRPWARMDFASAAAHDVPSASAPAPAPAPVPVPVPVPVHTIMATDRNAAWARRMLKERSLRGAAFRPGLFGDPGWEVLLELYLAKLLQRRTFAAKLGLDSGAGPTTVLRWLHTLEREGLVARCADRLDARRTFIELTDEGLDAMNAYVATLGKEAAPG